MGGAGGGGLGAGALCRVSCASLASLASLSFHFIGYWGSGSFLARCHTPSCVASDARAFVTAAASSPVRVDVSTWFCSLSSLRSSGLSSMETQAETCRAGVAYSARKCRISSPRTAEDREAVLPTSAASGTPASRSAHSTKLACSSESRQGLDMTRRVRFPGTPSSSSDGSSKLSRSFCSRRRHPRFSRTPHLPSGSLRLSSLASSSISSESE
mmetsp:Transcript_120394/g.341101  ORF Transcript_120394/g.341101 Transcript_120394/m.341101 type:complete len:213 (+) Transcript_120394:258-896(+)